MDLLVRTTQALASFVAELDRSSIPDNVWDRTKLIVADTLGVAVKGAEEGEVRALARTLPAEGTSVIFHPGFPRVDCDSAAVVNAISICSQELDEGARPTGHPALHVLPVTLALAQSIHASGTEFLTSFIAGYEIQSRIQRAAALRQNIHPHGNFGNIGAIVAIGKLLKWSEPQLVEGMNAAAAFAMATSWQACIAGATIRNAYPAATAHIALLVRKFIECGFTGYDGAISETYGELLGDSINLGVLTDELGVRFGVMDNYFKFHASCALVHPVLDALLDALGLQLNTGKYPFLVSAAKIDVSSIDHVEVRVLPRSMRLCQVARSNSLSAKFSIPFGVATFLKNGVCGPESFHPDFFEDAELVHLQKLVQVIPMDEWSDRWPAEHPAEVCITLKNGKQIRGASSNPYGSQATTINPVDLLAKFNTLTERGLSKEEQITLWSHVLHIDELKDVANFPV